MSKNTDRMSVNVRVPESYAETKLKEVSKILDRIEKIQMHGLDEFRVLNYQHTRRSLARLLKVLLASHAAWLQLAHELYEVSESVASELRNFERSIDVPSRYRLSVSRGESERNRRASSLGCNVPGEVNYLAALRLARAWTAILARADALWSAFEPYRRPPKYTHVTPILPLGGKLAYSLLFVADAGSLSDNKPDMHRMFGWTCYRHEKTKVCAAMLAAAHAVKSRAKEPGGPRPSWKAGVAFVSRYRTATEQHPRHKTDRINKMWREGVLFNGEKMSQLLLGVTPSNPRSMLRPSLVLRAWQNRKAVRKWCAIALKISPGCSDRHIPTLLLARPECISSTFHIYKARAAWSEDGDPAQGVVLLRRGWDDIIHVSETDGEISDQELAARVLQTSNRSLKERRKPRKAIADVCWKLRKLETICVEDSFKAGNCRPGTQHFLAVVGLNDVRQIPGPQLARLWRKAKYPDQARLENVADTLMAQRLV